MATRIYLGLNASVGNVDGEVFRAGTMPTFDTHGERFNAVVGPFRTMRGARFMRDCGRGNPHVQCVADAERIALRLAAKGGA